MLIVKSLLPRINMQSDFTDATVVAFCKAIKLHLPNVANTATSRDGQDARVEQLMASVRTEISLPGTTGAHKEMEADQLVALYRRTIVLLIFFTVNPPINILVFPFVRQC